MEESIVKNCGNRRVRNAGLEFPASPAPVENTSADYRDDVNWPPTTSVLAVGVSVNVPLPGDVRLATSVPVPDSNTVID